ncbi:MAG TPA: glycosyltransferase family 87 protein [Ktedonobacteraceae bacterium]|nr:glycosyltransferase family 87 protein [Ktedonobacteraceae bacterium]
MPSLQTAPLEKRQGQALQRIPAPRRLLILGALLLLSAICYGALIRFISPDDQTLVVPFVLMWLACFIPYLAACALVLLTPAPEGRQLWYELGLIVLGAVLFRGMMLPWPPNLSHDSWRYLWDARVTLNGYSPYVLAPRSPELVHLQDNLIYGNSRFRNVPSLYPPAAQAVYVLSYLLAPSNLVFLKGIFVGFDLLSCGLIGYMLWRRGYDVRRMVLYAWCPLPIVEFATQGHLDAMPIAVILLFLIVAHSPRRGARVLTGVLIGIATLMKLYPIVLLLVVVRWKDWGLVLACFVTIILGYIPYYILGHGQIFGFFSTYIGEQGLNAGIIQVGLQWIKNTWLLNYQTTYWIERSVDLVVMGLTGGSILWLRWKGKLTMEAGSLILLAAVLAISSHVFPWYTAILLALMVVDLGPIWTPKGLVATDLALISFWYLVFGALGGYFLTNTHQWLPFYILVYDVMLVILLAAAALGFWRWRKQRVIG